MKQSENSIVEKLGGPVLNADRKKLFVFTTRDRTWSFTKIQKINYDVLGGYLLMSQIIMKLVTWMIYGK